jgi:hypothetical protein
MSYLDREIKPSNCTQFPIGAKVKITHSGRCYSGYRDMAEYMRLNIQLPSNPFRNGDVGVVVAKAMHEYESSGEVLAVRLDNGSIGLMAVSGVVEYEEPLKAIDMKDMVVGQVVRLVDEGRDGHKHWHFVAGGEYTVRKDEYNCTGPASPKSGNVPSRNWAEWKWVLVSDVPAEPEPTVEELKAELATVKAKLWEAEWKLNKISEVAKDGIL